MTGNRQAYEYLERSASSFPSGEAFVDLMERSGRFATVDYRPLTLGVAYLYRGVKK